VTRYRHGNHPNFESELLGTTEQLNVVKSKVVKRIDIAQNIKHDTGNERQTTNTHIACQIGIVATCFKLDTQHQT
jgi:hypothetical protein